MGFILYWLGAMTGGAGFIGSVFVAIAIIVIGIQIFTEVVIPGYLLWADYPFTAMALTIAFTVAYGFEMKVIDARSKIGGSSSDWSVYAYLGLVFLTTVLPLIFLWGTGLSLFFYTEFFNLLLASLAFAAISFFLNFLKPFVGMK